MRMRALEPVATTEMQDHSPFDYAQTQQALADVCEQLDDAQFVAVDTEFVRESTYFPKLCLIQLATDKLTACIDCLADLDLTPLLAQLLDRDVTWIVHSGRQDIEVVWHAAGTKPAQVYDTQIAAGLLGEAPQVGLRELLRSTLGVEIGKAFTRTNWAKRPLDAGAIDYAIDDVRHLLPLWRELAERLESRGRLAWFLEDCARALEAPLEPDLMTLYQRTKGTGRLDRLGIKAALSLLSWREDRAKRVDRPRRWVLADETLVAIAAQRPRSLAELHNVDGLTERVVAKSGDALLTAVMSSSDLRFDEEPPAFSANLDPKRLKSLQARVRDCASRLGIEPEVLAAKRDIAACMMGSPPTHLVSGWRAEHLHLPVADMG